MKKNILIVGAGAVGTVVAHKCAQNGDRFGAVCLSSKSLRKCEAVLRSIERRGYPRARACRLVAREVDARDTRALIQLFVETQADIVINVCTAFVNMSVIEACLATGAAYLDTAVHEDPAVLNAPYPWYANFEWKRREDFARRGLTAILGVGFDPEKTTPGHFGLNGMRQRVKLLRGTATIHSELGKGTCVTVELPLAP